MIFCFSDLYPDIFPFVQQDNSQEKKEKIRKQLGIGNQKSFLEKVLPPELFPHVGNSKPQINRFFNGKADKHCRKIKDCIISCQNSKTEENYVYKNWPSRLTVVHNWERLLNNPFFTQEKKDNLSDQISKIVSDIADEHEDIRVRLHQIMEGSLEERLTCLTFIAATYCFWDRQMLSANKDDRIDAHMLRLMILPEGRDDSFTEEDIARIKEETEMASAEATHELDGINLTMAEFDDSIKSLSMNICKKLLAANYLRDFKVRGRACLYLYRLCSMSGDLKTAEEYLDESCRYGYSEALEVKKAHKSAGLVYQPEKNISSMKGRIIFNGKNSYTKLFERSVPQGWTKFQVEDFGSLNFEDVNQTLPQKYLFFSDDFRKNLVDLMDVLEIIRLNEAYYLCDNIDIYIRCSEELCGSLIDTAQNNLDGNALRIHILDDAKMAAHQLLGCHPVFYPIRGIGNEEVPLLHFVIVGSNMCAQWLVREAFWLMTFLPDEVLTKITVLSEDAAELYKQIVTKCPGLNKNSNIQKLFGESILTPIETESADLDSRELEMFISKCMDTKAFLYFAVSTDDDEKNLSLALRIREHIIRNDLSCKGAFSDKKNILNKLHSLPPVAFLCRDENIAHLSKNLIVNDLNCGDSWYNNYALIPFGARSERYTWQNLDGGIIEKLSFCVHLEYDGITPDYVSDILSRNKNDKRKDSANSYYGRQYNKDSSRSVALSLPYRLFNIRNYKSRNRLIREAWNILDGSSYYSRDTLEKFAQLTAFLHPDSKESPRQFAEETIEKLSAWEQIRWSRYMLSRGWLPASVQQVNIYRTQSYKKHQLYIARLHPAICDYTKLGEVQNALKKDFQKYNRKNLQNTSRILRLEWLEMEKTMEMEEPDLDIGI